MAADLTSYAGLGALFKAGGEDTTFDPAASVMKVTAAMQAMDNLRQRRALMAAQQDSATGEAQASGQTEFERLMALAAQHDRANDTEGASRLRSSAQAMMKDMMDRDPQQAAVILSRFQRTPLQANAPGDYELKPDAAGRIMRIPKFDRPGGPQYTGVQEGLELEKAALAAQGLIEQGVDPGPQLMSALQMWKAKQEKFTPVAKEGFVAPSNPAASFGRPQFAYPRTGGMPVAAAPGGPPAALPGAAGGGPMPASSGMVITDRDGTRRQNPAQGGMALGAELRQKLQENLSEIGGAITSGMSTAENFNPEYLSYAGKVKALAYAEKSKLSPGSLTPAESEYLKGYTNFSNFAAHDLNKSAFDLGGKTLSATELARVTLEKPNPDDAPPAFMAKLENNMAAAAAVHIKSTLVLQTGLPPTALPDAGEMQRHIKEQATKLTKTYTGQGMEQGKALATAYRVIRAQYPTALMQHLKSKGK